MKVSDELREWAYVHCGGGCAEYLGMLADRIDRETIELPMDAYGVPVHIGDTVWECASGTEITVRNLRMNTYKRWVISAGSGLLYAALEITHERPDSLKYIADDIEARIGTGAIDGPTLRKWVERIRKFAKEDGYEACSCAAAGPSSGTRQERAPKYCRFDTARTAARGWWTNERAHNRRR